MAHLLLNLFFGDGPFSSNAMGLWIFLSVGAIALFVVFIPLVTWIDSRRKEREAFYQADTMRRLTESTTDGAKAAMELMREQARQERIKMREGLKIGGIITAFVGIGVVALLNEVGGPKMAGLIPLLVGVAMLVYVYLLSPRVD
jgi:hypothetical protein